jgi:hypothetical protein
MQQYTCKLTPVPVPLSVLAALDVVTPPLDGTILPGVTRASVLSLPSHRPHDRTPTPASNAPPAPRRAHPDDARALRSVRIRHAP